MDESLMRTRGEICMDTRGRGQWKHSSCKHKVSPHIYVFPGQNVKNKEPHPYICMLQCANINNFLRSLTRFIWENIIWADINTAIIVIYSEHVWRLEAEEVIRVLQYCIFACTSGRVDWGEIQCSFLPNQIFLITNHNKFHAAYLQVLLILWCLTGP